MRGQRRGPDQLPQIGISSMDELRTQIDRDAFRVNGVDASAKPVPRFQKRYPATMFHQLASGSEASDPTTDYNDVPHGSLLTGGRKKAGILSYSKPFLSECCWILRFTKK